MLIYLIRRVTLRTIFSMRLRVDIRLLHSLLPNVTRRMSPDFKFFPGQIPVVVTEPVEAISVVAANYSELFIINRHTTKNEVN